MRAPTQIVAEDPCQLRNRANYERLNKISADLLAEAIGIFRTMTPLQARNFRMRNLRWHGGTLREGDEWGEKTGKILAEFDGEKHMVARFIEGHVHPDNWELVRLAEGPRFQDREQPRAFVPAVADSPNDTWPEEKRAVYDFVTASVSAENRHLVKLLNPEDVLERKAKRRAKVVASTFDTPNRDFIGR